MNRIEETAEGRVETRLMTLKEYVAIRKGALREMSHRLIAESQPDETGPGRSRFEAREATVVFG